MKLLHKLMTDRKGGTAIEYGLIATIIVVSLIASMVQLGNTTTSIWGNVNNKMDDARNGR
ncbi:MAG: pilus assembly protein [Sphingomonas sp. 28-63-12]|nr:MAG: pilus assembly protein [Sphingomonas sp. 28-63-12]